MKLRRCVTSVNKLTIQYLICQYGAIPPCDIIPTLLYSDIHTKLNMTEEKQEGQKTVVSFIVGLLIGGLLVWAFSGPAVDAPEDKDSNTAEKSENVDSDDEDNDDEDEDESEDDDTGSADNDTVGDKGGSSAPVVEKKVLEVGNGEIKLSSEQNPSSAIKLESATYPVKEGWIGVRDYQNGQLGFILGVVRFSEEQGLVPEEIILQRPTISGREYAVVIYEENGDRQFNLAEDVQIDKIFSTFKVK